MNNTTNINNLLEIINILLQRKKTIMIDRHKEDGFATISKLVSELFLDQFSDNKKFTNKFKYKSTDFIFNKNNNPNYRRYYYRSINPINSLPNIYELYTLQKNKKNGVIYLTYQQTYNNVLRKQINNKFIFIPKIIYNYEVHCTIVWGGVGEKYKLLSDIPYIHYRQIIIHENKKGELVNKNTFRRIRDDNINNDPKDWSFYGYYKVRNGEFDKEAIGENIAEFKPNNIKNIVAEIRSNINRPENNIIDIVDKLLNHPFNA